MRTFKQKTKYRLTVLSSAILLAAMAQAVSANDPRTDPEQASESEQPVTDTRITTKVKSTLLATEGVAGTDINVTTVDGVVTLAGVLDTQAAVDKAIEVTRSIEGVVDVDTRALKVR